MSSTVYLLTSHRISLLIPIPDSDALRLRLWFIILVNGCSPFQRGQPISSRRRRTPDEEHTCLWRISIPLSGSGLIRISAARPKSRRWPGLKSETGGTSCCPRRPGPAKTLAAFLAVLNDLFERCLDGTLEDRTQVVYVSPLKALSNDIHRNLQLPLKGIKALLEQNGHPAVDVRAKVRTGDTPSTERAKMVRTPPHILVTTPESLYLLLTSNGGREMLSDARTLIVDEIHAVAGNKRGAHLSISMERLARLSRNPLHRIGISATQKPIDRMARFLTGGRGIPAQSSIPDIDANWNSRSNCPGPRSPR